MLDPVEFGKAMAVIVRDAQAPLLKRIEELEARKPQNGEPGKDGTSVTLDDVAPMIERAVRTAVDAIPKPKDGKDGRDADQIDVRDVVSELLARDECSIMAKLAAAEAVAQYMGEHPIRDGEDGEDGDDGKDATDEQVERAVAKYLKENPPVPGEKGADGIGLASALIDRDGCLIITTTKGEGMNLGVVVGKDGDPGKDGADLSDVSLEFDGHRTVTIKARGGEVVKTYRLDIPMDRGYWRENMACEKSDIVTHNGNAWLALCDTKAKPCLENKEDWRLFARKGRDGNHGKDGRDMGPPPPVKLNDA